MSLVYSAAQWPVSLERFSVFAKKIIFDVFNCDKWRFREQKHLRARRKRLHCRLQKSIINSNPKNKINNKQRFPSLQ